MRGARPAGAGPRAAARGRAACTACMLSTSGIQYVLSAREWARRGGHDGVGLLAGTALSQPGQAVSQRRRAGRSPCMAAHDGAAAEPGRGQHVAAECRSTGRAHAPESD
eukprot:COSAG01_NODE_4133_length_5319_cov_102.509004_1_plen_108_part_10